MCDLVRELTKDAEMKAKKEKEKEDIIRVLHLLTDGSTTSYYNTGQFITS